MNKPYLKNQYDVDPECSQASLKKHGDQRFLNPSYPSNQDFEEGWQPEEEVEEAQDD